MYPWQVFENCEHPPGRLYAWIAFDEELVVAYCECGAVLCAADEGESEKCPIFTEG